MIALHAVSPQNDMPVAVRLVASIVAAWRDIVESRYDRLDVLVGVRTPVDVDILVVLDLAKPRTVPGQRRRSGGPSAPSVARQALIAIEVKQLDVDRFRAAGQSLFPRYDAGAGRERSVAIQACDAALGVFVVRPAIGL